MRNFVPVKPTELQDSDEKGLGLSPAVLSQKQVDRVTPLLAKKFDKPTIESTRQIGGRSAYILSIKEITGKRHIVLFWCNSTVSSIFAWVVTTTVPRFAKDCVYTSEGEIMAIDDLTGPFALTFAKRIVPE